MTTTDDSSAKIDTIFFNPSALINELIHLPKKRREAKLYVYTFIVFSGPQIGHHTLLACSSIPCEVYEALLDPTLYSTWRLYWPFPHLYPEHREKENVYNCYKNVEAT